METDAGKELDSQTDRFVWGKWRVAIYSAIALGVAFAIQAGLVIVWLGVELATTSHKDLRAFAEGLETNGMLVSVSAFASALVTIPIIVRLVRRHEAKPFAFLGLISSPPRQIAFWCAVTIAFVVIGDFLTYGLGRAIVPDWVARTVESGPLWTLVPAIVLVAPVLEELLFRGLLFRGLIVSGSSPVVAVVVSALTWAAIHLQYDGFTVGQISLFGLLLGWARTKTGSTLVCIVMHALANLIALAEALYFR